MGVAEVSNPAVPVGTDEGEKMQEKHALTRKGKGKGKGKEKGKGEPTKTRNF